MLTPRCLHTQEKLIFWQRTRDKDKSGDVSWQEYAESKALLILDQRNALKDALTEDEIHDAKMVFASIDSDGSGSISESEARRFFDTRAQRDVENGAKTNPSPYSTLLTIAHGRQGFGP